MAMKSLRVSDDSRVARRAVAGSLRTRAFTLLELSIVIAIIAAITAVGVSAGSSMIESAKRTATRNKLDVIEEALMSFRLANNRLPCPADETLATGNAYFGFEAGTLSGGTWAPDLGVCTTGGTYTPTTNGSYTGGVLTGTAASSVAANYNVLIPKGANATNIAFNTYVAEGGVPVKALNLPNEFAFDSWGNHIAYAVWAPDTAENAFLTYGISPSCGAITVNDAGGLHRSQAAVYALTSYGPDGNGGYPQKGGTARINAGVANSDEQANCHCTSTGADNTGYTATYVQKETHLDPSDPKNPFQQQVRYKERWQLVNPYDDWAPNGLPCTPGFRIIGTASYNVIPASGMLTCDVDGDGVPDLVMSDSTKVYVLFGTSSLVALSSPFDPSQLDGNNGFVIKNGIAGGVSLACADVNNDGYADIIMASNTYGSSGYPGQGTYVLFGRPKPWSASVDLNKLAGYNPASPAANDGHNGFYIKPSHAWTADIFHVTTGDINGDGYADIIIGDNEYGNAGKNGEIDAVFGGVGTWPATVNVASLNGYNPSSPGANGTNGFIATAGSWANQSIYLGFSSMTGDLNGDNTADLVVARDDPCCNSSTLYVMFGQKNATWPATINLDSLSHTTQPAGTQIGHVPSSFFTGVSLGVADFNNDAVPDLLVGASYGIGNGVSTTQVGYIVFGQTGIWPDTINNITTLTHATSPKGTTLVLPAATSNAIDSGITAAPAGDVNKDGIQDFIVGVPNVNNTGSAYVVFGANNLSNSPTFDLSTLNGTNGFRIDGVNSGDLAGGQVWGGDITGDGYAEIMVGATHTSPNGISNVGTAYVLYGKKKWASPLLLSTVP